MGSEATIQTAKTRIIRPALSLSDVYERARGNTGHASLEIPRGGVDVFGLPDQAASRAVEAAQEKSEPKPSAAIMCAADIGHLVRIGREERQLSQQALAELAGVGRRFVSELENGKSTVEFGKVLKVASAAGIDLFARTR